LQDFQSNKAIEWKISMFGGKNSTVKYATTVEAAWNVKFVGFNDENISLTGEIWWLKFYNDHQFGLLYFNIPSN
jgi:hypothetical protein